MPASTPAGGASRSAPSRSASADSPIPNALTVRIASGGSPKRCRQARAELSVHIRRISDGTPGMSATTEPSRSTHHPGAEPIGFGTASADGISCAWRRLAAGIGPNARKRSSSVAISAGSSASVSPSASARPSRVRSSCVGPSPPVASTTAERARGLDECVADGGAVVGKHPGVAQRDAECGQLAAQEGGVRVDRLAEQQLTADREQLGVHHRGRVYG